MVWIAMGQMWGCLIQFLMISSHSLVISLRKTSDFSVVETSILIVSSSAGANGLVDGLYGIGVGIVVSRGLQRLSGDKLVDDDKLVDKLVMGSLNSLNSLKNGLTGPPKM